MANQRIELRELRAITENGRVSRLDFASGLNVITGASDTGKSYILDSINYMLGGQTPPEDIPEAADYVTLALGLTVTNGDASSFGLERSRKDGGDFHIFLDGREPMVLGARHSDTGRSLSEYLLESCGFRGKRIRKRADQSRELRFRDIVMFVLVSETRIIDKASPVKASGQYVSETEELSTFNLLITGRDVSSMVLLPDKKSVKIDWEARRALYEELIVGLKLELASSPLANTTTGAEDSGLESDIQSTAERVRNSTVSLNEAVAQRARVQRARQRLESRAASLTQLVERFTLLREHYTSDKERLRFLAEGDYLLAQLGEAHCPTCGQPLIDHDATAAAHSDANAATIQQATRSEIAKLDVQLLDLDGSLNALHAELASIRQEVEAQGVEMARLETTIQNTLEPALFATRDAMTQLVARREAAARLAAKRTELAELEARRQAMGEKPPARKRVANAVESTLERREFCDRMAETLTAWKYPVQVVEFDSKSDLVIDGKARRSFGKGMRAVIHAAFNVSLLRYTRDKELPHPGFIVLDSPLTSFRERDDYEVAGDIQRAFFEDLSRETTRQIVVIENKEPPPDIRARMRYVHFSGAPAGGRSGFFV